MLHIKNAEFKKSIALMSDYFNEGMPEFAIVGKSNVGKSSLINMLTNNAKLARVSKQPGKTRLINYFLINRAIYMVDLPGYGYARVSKAEKESWDEMMGSYFAEADFLKCVLVLIDIRHKPTEADSQMIMLLEHYQIPYIVVATKADKIAKSKRKPECESKRKHIKSSYVYDIIPVAHDGTGKEVLLTKIDEMLRKS